MALGHCGLRLEIWKAGVCLACPQPSGLLFQGSYMRWGLIATSEGGCLIPEALKMTRGPGCLPRAGLPKLQEPAALTSPVLATPVPQTRASQDTCVCWLCTHQAVPPSSLAPSSLGPASPWGSGPALSPQEGMELLPPCPAPAMLHMGLGVGEGDRNGHSRVYSTLRVPPCSSILSVWRTGQEQGRSPAQPLPPQEPITCSPKALETDSPKPWTEDSSPLAPP